jgi:hypothetical protein
VSRRRLQRRPRKSTQPSLQTIPLLTTTEGMRHQNWDRCSSSHARRVQVQRRRQQGLLRRYVRNLVCCRNVSFLTSPSLPRRWVQSADAHRQQRRLRDPFVPRRPGPKLCVFIHHMGTPTAEKRADHSVSQAPPRRKDPSTRAASLSGARAPAPSML